MNLIPTKHLACKFYNTSAFISIILFFISLTSFATIITVRQDGTGDFETIQEGVNASAAGDTVLVYPGIYNESIYYNNKNITLASLYLTTQERIYISQTVIDPGYNGESALGIGYCPGGYPIVDGFTIQHGGGSEYEGRGGGIDIDNVDCEIRNCVIQNNIAKYGGGICVEDCSVVIKNCIIQNNVAMSGGGIYCRINATVIFSADYIRFNHAKLAGGGIRCGYNSNTVFDQVNLCSIYLNYSPYGSDYLKWNESPAQEIYVDTFTVLNPDQHFIYSYDDYNYPVYDLTIDIQHAKIEPVSHDLFVNPITGSDLNDGISPENPLKTIAYAYHIIESESLNPHTVYLSPGTYSPSTNNEKFPLNGRSYVSLVGTHRDSTIFDADSSYYFFRGYGLMECFSLENISFINGYGNLSSTTFSGIALNNCNNVRLANLNIQSCISSSNPAIYSSTNDKISFSDITIQDCSGGFCFTVWNNFEPAKTFQINNCKIINNGPDSDPEQGVGGGLSIGSTEITPHLYYGQITNIQITDNLQEIEPDPFWGPGSTVGITTQKQAKVDLINATIGNNIVRHELGTAVNVDEGAELNIYNSILYGDSLLEMSLGSYSGSYLSATANISHSNLEGGEDAILNWYDQHTLNWLEGNMDANPLWIGTGDSAYQLQWNSPCIDAGVPMYEPGMDYPYIKIENERIVLYKIDGDTLHIPSTDLAGNPRIVKGRIDMGAYEFQDTTTAIKELFLKNIQETKIQVYPNPFYLHTFISFKLQENANVQTIIYNLAGQQVKKLMDAQLATGEYRLTWEGDNDQGQATGPGTYIVCFIINGKKAASAKVVKKKWVGRF